MRTTFLMSMAVAKKTAGEAPGAGPELASAASVSLYYRFSCEILSRYSKQQA